MKTKQKILLKCSYCTSYIQDDVAGVSVLSVVDYVVIVCFYCACGESKYNFPIFVRQ